MLIMTCRTTKVTGHRPRPGQAPPIQAACRTSRREWRHRRAGLLPTSRSIPAISCGTVALPATVHPSRAPYTSSCLPAGGGRTTAPSMVRTARQLNVDWPITRHDHVDFATSARNGHRTIDGRVLLRPSSRVHEPCIWSGAVALTVTDGLDPIRVAVGTALAGGPPHRSQRAGLPHWAPTLGAWRRSAPAGMDARCGSGVSTGSRCGSSWPR